MNKTNIEDLIKEYEEFTYIVSHDLKAPLRAISNLTEWIEEDLGEDVPEDVHTNFNLLKRRVKKMAAMIDALALLSRVERRNLDIVEVNVSSVLEEIKKEIELQYKNTTLNINGKITPFKTYAKKFSFILEELIENAAKHNQNKEKLTIDVDVKLKGEYLEIKIQDNGFGVDEEALEKITKLFFTQESKDKSKTTGAGLTIVKKIINFVGGSLDIKNENDKFTVVINWPVEIKI